MEDLTNKPESEMGVPLGGGFGRLISPFEAEELVRRDKAKKRKAAQEAAASERREMREMRHKWIREEAEFEKRFSANHSPEEPISLSNKLGCAALFIVLFLIVSGLITVLESLRAMP